MTELSKESWLKERQNHIGASEVADILGFGRHGALYVWDQKINGTTNDLSDETGEIEFGLDAENGIAKMFKKRTGRNIINKGLEFVYHPQVPWLAATLDRYEMGSIDFPEPASGMGALEVKHVGAPKFPASEWSQDNQEILMHVVQNQIQMACAGLNWGSIVGLYPYYQLPWFDQLRDDDFIDGIIEELDKFWTNNVKNKIPPEPNNWRDLPVVKKLFPIGNKDETKVLGQVELELARKRHLNKQVIKTAQEQVSEIDAKLIFAMGTATKGILLDGSTLTLKSIHRKAYQVAETEYRELRHHQAK